MFIGYFTERPYQDPSSGYFGRTGKPIEDLSMSNAAYDPVLGSQLYHRYFDEKVKPNLDGQVNSADFTRLAQSFNQTSKNWWDGDSNFDGKVNALDFNLLAGNFGRHIAAKHSARVPCIPLIDCWPCGQDSARIPCVLLIDR